MISMMALRGTMPVVPPTPLPRLRFDLEVRRGDAHCLAVALEEDVRQNRERLARLHNVLHHLQALEKRVTVDYDFHEVLRWFSEKNNNSVVVTVCSRCGSGKLKVSGFCR